MGALAELRRELTEKDARARAEGLPGRGDTENLNCHDYRGASEREHDGVLRSCFTCKGWVVGDRGNLCQRIAHCIQEMDLHGTCNFWKRDLRRCPIREIQALAQAAE